jgi:hypothetical protein
MLRLLGIIPYLHMTIPNSNSRWHDYIPNLLDISNTASHQPRNLVFLKYNTISLLTNDSSDSSTYDYTFISAHVSRFSPACLTLTQYVSIIHHPLVNEILYILLVPRPEYSSVHYYNKASRAHIRYARSFSSA